LIESDAANGNTPPKTLTKNLTFGLGKIKGYDRRSHTVYAVDEDTGRTAYKALIQCFYDFAALCNYTTSLLYSSQILKADLKDWGFSTGYADILEKLQLSTPLSPRALSQAYVFASTHFRGKLGKDLRAGNTVLPTHKANGTHPLMLPSSGNNIVCSDGKYYLCLNLFRADWAKENNVPAWCAFELKIKKRDKSSRSELERIVSGEWKRGAAYLGRKREKAGYVGHIATTYPLSIKPLSDNIVMGVHFGYSVPATIHFRDKSGKAYDWELCIGKGDNMLAARNTVRNEIKRILQALKSKDAAPLSSTTREAMQNKLRKLRSQERNIIKTTAQRIASIIAYHAVRASAGCWQVESFDPEDKLNNPFLARNWSPSAIQAALDWQAQKVGATIHRIDRAYNSQRCSACGHTSQDNRRSTLDFACVSCGYTNHADKNAARNNSARVVSANDSSTATASVADAL